MTLVIDSHPLRPLLAKKIVRDFAITAIAPSRFQASPVVDGQVTMTDVTGATQLRVHGRVSDHILRKGGNVVWSRWSGAVPLWSESS